MSGYRRRQERKAAKKRKEMTLHRLRTVDPYLLTQRETRFRAHLERKQELAAERDAAWGSPVHGLTTPFVESFDSAGQDIYSRPPLDEDGRPTEALRELPMSLDLMNHNLTRTEVRETLEHAEALTRPYEETQVRDDGNAETDQRVTAELKTELDAHAAKHAKIAVAFERILNLTNAGGKHLRHANIRRCLDTFGRHNTDLTLPNAGPLPSVGMARRPGVSRAGPDTGSSEVQIAILTMKIRALAKAIESPKGGKDKHNKRNLRNMCHRRQKLLKYMERKERGSQRWHFMIDVGSIPSPYCFPRATRPVGLWHRHSTILPLYFKRPFVCFVVPMRPSSGRESVRKRCPHGCVIGRTHHPS